MAISVPPFRVNLKNWCAWSSNSNNPWEKVSSVVGHSYRIPGHRQNIYTLAASATLRLIKNYDIDPERIGYIALGTESSTDNSAGAIIVKGMVDDALIQSGLPPISRRCEVPEIKHACLGGMYALKGALRYLYTDGKDRQALVISSDVAEYEPGSSGEPTQGSGAVAMLIDKESKLAVLDLENCGSAACYRGADFRKPFTRFVRQNHISANNYPTVKDFPLINGQYSTHCYIDEMLAALEDMFTKRSLQQADYFHTVPAVFMHRPYHRLPSTAWGTAYLAALSQGHGKDKKELLELCFQSKVDINDVTREVLSKPNLFKRLQQGNSSSPYPLLNDLMKAFRPTDSFTEIVSKKMYLGSERMMSLGNLYTAALPAWIAAGLEHALEENRDCANEEWLTLGYGSGDAAEVMPMYINPSWQQAARKIQFDRQMQNPIDLSKEQYTELHATGYCKELEDVPAGEFIIERFGTSESGPIRDLDLEYYQYIG